jgi:hypothetical protein
VRLARIYISGTGRAGTTFLIQLLTKLGLDTGFSEPAPGAYFELARAGYEWDLFDLNAPRIVKSPLLCDGVDDLVARGFLIAHVIIPVRDAAAAADSRIRVQMHTTGRQDGSPVAGGLWGTEKACEQISVLQAKLSGLVEALARHDIPMTVLSFPRSVLDMEYLHRKLKWLVPKATDDEFRKAFEKTARPWMVHLRDRNRLKAT